MKEMFDDTVCMMLDELDQMILEGMREEPEYNAYREEFHALTEEISGQIPGPERCLTLSCLIGDMERRTALLYGMAAGTGFRQIFEGNNQQVLKQFLCTEFLSEIKDKQ
ncbi:hypothetical protein [Clostridium transplantifaecale]|uniref:hypothetical protein n=1 Tax=Clostridium transplantifaecale TaxID=2479838 RepID=UPI000F63A9EA|nr:hypothetical protein [Clostridium transplantifaecale]